MTTQRGKQASAGANELPGYTRAKPQSFRPNRSPFFSDDDLRQVAQEAVNLAEACKTFGLAADTGDAKETRGHLIGLYNRIRALKGTLNPGGYPGYPDLPAILRPPPFPDVVDRIRLAMQQIAAVLQYDLVSDTWQSEPSLAADFGSGVDNLIDAADRLWKLMRDAKESPRPKSQAGSPKMSPEKANEIAMKLAQKVPSFVNGGAEEWARKIGCSEGTVHKTALWKETMNQTGRGRIKGRKPKVVSLTEKVLARASRQESKEEILARLAAEQRTDYEPSPLEDDPAGRTQKVKCKRR